MKEKGKSKKGRKSKKAKPNQADPLKVQENTKKKILYARVRMITIRLIFPEQILQNVLVKT